MRVRVFASAGLGLVAALALGSPSAAAPYTTEAVIEVSTSNPAVGGTLTLTVSGFLPVELVDLMLHSTPFPLGTLTTNNQGAGSAVIELPEHLTCRHHITATGRTSGEVARADLVIGDLAACAAGGNPGAGNTGSGNTGSGNTGNGNIGHGNTGNGNVGHGNTGNGNVGHGNTGSGNVGSGNTPYGSAPAYGPDGNPAASGPNSMTYQFEPVSSGSTTLAAGTVAATAVLGGVFFLTQRRRTR